MGAINGRTRRHRRNRLAAEMYCTWTPRRLFTFGSSVGWAHWFDDPNTLYRRRNRLTYTRDFGNAAWTKTNILSVTADADGVGDLVVPNTTNSTHILVQVACVVGASHVLVVRAKAGGYNHIAFTAGTPTGYANINAGTGGTVSGGATVSVSAASDAPGYYDCTFTFVATSANCTLYVANADGSPSFTGDGTSGVYIARAQLETYTTTPTEYQDVPTTWPQAYLDAVGADRIYAWKDTAGTDPVTAVGEGIGLLLGREYGGATGPSLLANGTTGLTGTATAASYNTSTFAGSVSRAGDASNQSWVTWTGLTTDRVFRIRITNTGATSLDVRNGGVAGTIVASIAAGATSWVHPSTLSASTSITITATTNGTTATFTLSQFNLVPGTHLTQATGTARPTLSARVNVLRSTEALTNATDWVVSGSGAVTSGFSDPNGGTTAFRIVTSTSATNSGIYQGGLTVTNVSQLESVWLRGNVGGEQVMIGDATFRTTVTLTTSWQRFTGTSTKGSAFFVIYSNSLAQTWYAWRPDSRTADDAAKNIPAYQRVGATAADHDTAGFPHYALFDGSDDSWASAATVDGSATDKVTVVTGVTKNSDAATGIALEFGPTSSATAGTFGLLAPAGSASPSFGSYLYGSSANIFSVSGNAAPLSAVVSQLLDISLSSAAAENAIRVNGMQTASSGGVAGTGNFTVQTLYFGSRTASTLRFNGREYASIGRFGPMSETERNRLESWTKNLMRLP